MCVKCVGVFFVYSMCVKCVGVFSCVGVCNVCGCALSVCVCVKCVGVCKVCELMDSVRFISTLFYFGNYSLRGKYYL